MNKRRKEKIKDSFLVEDYLELLINRY